MSYGVISTGFAKKPLDVIVTELEDAAKTAFGPEIIVEPESPMGQIIGLMADIAADQWETTEGTYQSFDVDQAEGPRLDTIAKLRRLQRPDEGETDLEFRQRINNEARADISTTAVINAIKAIEGVTWAAVRINATSATGSLGLPGHSVAYAVVGGDDVAVATAVYQNTVAGIGLHGNTQVEIIADGYCQTVDLIRPEDVSIHVEIDVRELPDSCDCAPPSITTVRDAVLTALDDECGYRNGDIVREVKIKALAAKVDGIEVVEVRIGREPALVVAADIQMGLFERPVFDALRTTIRYV